MTPEEIWAQIEQETRELPESGTLIKFGYNGLRQKVIEALQMAESRLKDAEVRAAALANLILDYQNCDFDACFHGDLCLKHHTAFRIDLNNVSYSFLTRLAKLEAVTVAIRPLIEYVKKIEPLEIENVGKALVELDKLLEE